MTAMTTPNHCNNPTIRKVRRRRLPCTRRYERDSSNWRPAISALSLLLALSHDATSHHGHVHVSAFAPTTSATLEATTITPTNTNTNTNIHPNIHTNTRTSISFRNVDDDDSTSSSILRGMGSDTTSSATSTSRSQTTIDAASHLESMFSKPTVTFTAPYTSRYTYRYTEHMPSWLRPQGYLAEEALTALRQIMKESSYLSHFEAEKVIAAVQEASHGDAEQMTGAAEFCHTIVETMDMAASVETLIAAAFHYCECFSARTHEAQQQQEQQDEHLPSSSDSSTSTCSSTSTASSMDGFSYLWDFYKTDDPNDYLNSRAIKIGQDAHLLVQSAARIKRAEMMVSQSSNVKPTPEEAAGMIKMLLSETMDWRALAIRSAACLYRLRGIHNFYQDRDGDDGRPYTISPKDMRVAREALCIHAPLASRLGMHRLKNEIEGAAFSILYPRQHAEVTNMTEQNKPCNNSEEEECIISNLRDGMRIILNQVTQRVENLLETDPYFSKYVDSDSVRVTARIKEPYSLWRKMLKVKADNIFDVPDALALRVVFDAKKKTPDEDDDVTSARERALCYYVQKSCVNIFQPVKERNGRFKDYIARPKPNGYQSLHYTAFTTVDGEEWPFEIQVRTGDMHQVAEYGLAAHWDYKAQDKSEEVRPSLDTSSDAYLRSVQEWHWQQAQARDAWVTESSSLKSSCHGSACANESMAPYLEKLMRDQSNLAREHVFVFLSCDDSSNTGTCNRNSQILELPAGACVLDAIRESERSFGYNSRHLLDDEIVHNGSPTSVTRQLSNGDIVTIPVTTANTSPSSTMSP